MSDYDISLIIRALGDNGKVDATPSRLISIILSNEPKLAPADLLEARVIQFTSFKWKPYGASSDIIMQYHEDAKNLRPIIAKLRKSNEI